MCPSRSASLPLLVERISVSGSLSAQCHTIIELLPLLDLSASLPLLVAWPTTKFLDFDNFLVLKLYFCALDAHQWMLHSTLIFTFNSFGVAIFCIKFCCYKDSTPSELSCNCWSFLAVVGRHMPLFIHSKVYRASSGTLRRFLQCTVDFTEMEISLPATFCIFTALYAN